IASKSSASGPKSRWLTWATVCRAASGNPPAPWQAPQMAPVIAAIVSQSPPKDAAMRQASQGSLGQAAATANAAGTDSWAARPVPTSRDTGSLSPAPPSPVPRPGAQVAHAATAAPGVVRAGDRVPAPGGARGGGRGTADRGGQRVPVDSRAHRHGDGSRAGQGHPGVVGQPAGRDHAVLQQAGVAGGGGDAHRRD